MHAGRPICLVNLQADLPEDAPESQYRRRQTYLVRDGGSYLIRIACRDSPEYHSGHQEEKCYESLARRTLPTGSNVGWAGC